MNQGAANGTDSSPRDPADRRLREAVHPSGWLPPAPAECYDLVVIGAGTAGLVTAAGAAGLGARVALVERHLMGGDCLNTGCVPSKSLLASARAAHAVRQASLFGIVATDPVVDFAAVMRRLRETRATLSTADSAERFRGLGVDVFFGEARFERDRVVSVGNVLLRWRKAVIATGARPRLPDIPGLSSASPLTNQTIFNLDELPAHLAVIGAGPIGCELAQAFRRLGSEVTLIFPHEGLLPRDESWAGGILAERFLAEGIKLLPQARVERVETLEAAKHLSVVSAGERRTVVADQILTATGRRPNTASLNLAAVGVGFDEHGVKVDDFLRTTNRRIYAAGDVCLHEQFTHAADFSARLVIQNALFFGRKRFSRLNVPWCTYTDPEVAHTGLTEATAAQRGYRFTEIVREFAGVDRARTDGILQGRIRILVREGTDRILGATIVGPAAGELISEISVAMAGGLGLSPLANVIHPYPTLAEVIRQCGDAHNRTRLTPAVRRLLRCVLRTAL